jgi:hypothetical protein
MATLDQFVQDGTSGLFLPMQSRRQLLPFADMHAVSLPERLSTVATDLISALSVLVAQGPDRPRLLLTDTLGRLKVQAEQASLTTFTAPFTGGGTVASVFDSSAFYPGQICTLVGNISGTGECTDVVVASIPDPNTLKFNGTCGGFNYVIGDFIVGGSDVRVTQILVPPTIGGEITMIPPGAPNPGIDHIGMVSNVAGHKRFSTDPYRSLDKQLRSGLVQPGIASIQFAAPGLGNAWVLKWVTAGMLNNTAAASTPILQVWDGPSGTGTVVYDEVIFVPAGVSAVIDRTERYIRGTNNTAMTLVWDRGGANLFEWINAGCVLEGV